MVTLGCAHVQGDYSVDHGQGSFLANGLWSITRRLGLGVVKVFLSPTYDAVYPGMSWPGGISSLAELAASPPFVAAFADDAVSEVFVNAYTFNDQASDLWKFGFAQQPTYLANEYAEIRSLAEYLLTTYAGTGKSFTLQSWEGDWSLINGRDATNASQPSNDPDNYIRPQTVEAMRAWLRTRITAIEDARRAVGQNHVCIHSAIELNRIRDAFTDRSRKRVINSVLPHLRPDRVSYSAYDTILGPNYTYGDNQAALVDATRRDLGLALDLIRSACPHATPYIGEYGFAETELPSGYDVATLIANVIDVCDEHEATHALYWQVWDNESPRGFACENAAGVLTGAGTAFAALSGS